MSSLRLWMGFLILGLWGCAVSLEGSRSSQAPSEAAYQAGTGHYVQRDNTKALKELEVSLALDPGNKDAKRLMLVILREESERLLEENKSEQAKEMVHRLVTFFPEDPTVKDLQRRLQESQPEEEKGPELLKIQKYQETALPKEKEVPPPQAKEPAEVQAEPPKFLPPAPPVESLAPEPLPKKFRERYLVREGDTLESLASELFRDPERWKDIYWANQYQIQRGIILPGQVLEMPTQNAERGTQN